MYTTRALLIKKKKYFKTKGNTLRIFALRGLGDANIIILFKCESEKNICIIIIIVVI